MESFDYVIVGAGIVGLSTARALIEHNSRLKIAIIDKEADIATHASGRNSGVIHAGFYYSADSLKARFTKKGNEKLRNFCRENRLPILECGKLVVAKNPAEALSVEELYKRGKANGVELEIVNQTQVEKLEPLAKSHEIALYSPLTASLDPVKVCQQIKEELLGQGVSFFFNTEFESYEHPLLKTSSETIETGFLINCAGLYADKVAQSLGVGCNYTMMPFKGLYLKAPNVDIPIRMHIYPVPDLANPFLGVHFTVTVDGKTKIGPTAMPAFWREQYALFEHFEFGEFCETSSYLIKMFFYNSFNFRQLAADELRKFSRSYLKKEASKLLKDHVSFDVPAWSTPGIRAQLVERATLKLVQDFVIEEAPNSLHVLNAVSPAFTCAFPIAEAVVERLSNQTLP